MHNRELRYCALDTINSHPPAFPIPYEIGRFLLLLRNTTGTYAKELCKKELSTTIKYNTISIDLISQCDFCAVTQSLFFLFLYASLIDA